jgi:hypothetical protein
MASVALAMTALCVVLAMSVSVSFTAQARDFEMGGDSSYVYSTAAPPPDAVTHHGAIAPHLRHARPHRAAKPLAKQ